LTKIAKSWILPHPRGRRGVIEPENPLMRRVSALPLALFLLIGCGGNGSETAVSDAAASSTAPLLETDMQRFLAVVQHHEAALIPEFTPPEKEESPDFSLPAEEIVDWFRGKFRDVFDTERQGAAWDRDAQWNKAFAAHKISGQRFASLARNVSLAIMRVRLDARVDIDQLVANAKRDVQRAHGVIDQIDAVPPEDQTRESRALRSRTAIELGRAVALLEFAELIHQVPDENAALVRRFSRNLKPLLPAHANEDLLAELSELARRETDAIEHASFETEAEPQARRPAAPRRRTK
jgi:hypothetical protein